MNTRERVARCLHELYEKAQEAERLGEAKSLKLDGVLARVDRIEKNILALLDGEPVVRRWRFRNDPESLGWHYFDGPTAPGDFTDDVEMQELYLAPPVERERAMLRRVLNYFDDISKREAWGPMVEEIRAILKEGEG